MITLLLLMSSGLQAFHLARIPLLSRPPLPLDFPYFLPSQFYLLQQQRSDDILHEFRHIVHFPYAARNDQLLQVLVQVPRSWQLPQLERLQPLLGMLRRRSGQLMRRTETSHWKFVCWQLLGSSSCPDGLWFEPSTGECAAPDEV